ncbi:ankyrin repeat domain-containing protein 29 isoform X1 [Spodoptera litura]|uniref:Ankyrin repeat domain-containing protein 29 isoform X1 n=1 Tax=Spodoptera litura TaxID=69820 RepID=A0A9J7IMR7_SPOLT|nr:ankyrin repeat domain-containing protein 29 isoform X1 [Spodoptera litura]
MSLKKESRTDVQFHLAALRGDCDRLRQLLDTGKVHIDSRDRDGTTPLILSAAMGHTECVRELLAQGADPACSRTTGTSALFFAAQGGFLDIARLLLDSGAAIDAPSMDGGTPLFVACQCGHLPVVDELIRRGANVNSCMKDKASPLFIAAQNGHEDVCAALVSAGAAVDAPRADRATPLWIAAQCGHQHVARRLLAAGAGPDHVRQVPTYRLVSAGAGPDHVRQVPTYRLVSAGAGPDHVRQDGATPLFKAAHKGHAAVVVELLKYKPNLGLLPNGQSALHGAAMFGQMSCVRLLARRSRLSLRNAGGLTALQAAAAARKHDVVAYLRRLEHELAQT